jgi:DNA-binding transcriptional regulator WhiA
VLKNSFKDFFSSHVKNENELSMSKHAASLLFVKLIFIYIYSPSLSSSYFILIEFHDVVFMQTTCEATVLRLMQKINFEYRKSFFPVAIESKNLTRKAEKHFVLYFKATNETTKKVGKAESSLI